ncbi:MAG: hypothetical protein Kow001_12010 [Acidobacteriota bacterium]
MGMARKPYFFMVTLVFLSGVANASPDELHVVSDSELRDALSRRAEVIEADRAEIRALLRSELVVSHLSGAFDLTRVEAALACLDDETLREVAARSRLVNNQLRGGIPQWVTSLIVLYIIVAILLMILLSRGGD